MGTTIAGNQHIGSNYKKMQYIWKQGLGGTNAEVEVYEEDRIFVYQFNPPYDQRDDGVLAVEFYYYYRKPTTNEFWTYCYDPDNYYIYPFLAWYDDEAADGGKWGGITTIDSEKISLVGRDSGWIHVTLHVEEYIWGHFTSDGVTHDNPLYIGLYSPIPVFCWDTSSSYSQNVTPYEINWDFSEYEDEGVYDLLSGGYLEECYSSRLQINDYPSFYITYRDVTPESFAYSVNESAVMNMTSGISKKSVYKKLLQDIKAACGVTNRSLSVNRTAPKEAVSFTDVIFRRQDYKRIFGEAANSLAACERKHGMCKGLFGSVSENDYFDSHLLFMRNADSENVSEDCISKKGEWFRRLEIRTEINSDVERQQVLFRAMENTIDIYALTFASRLFFRAVKTVAGFWDWLRGKIREANNVVSFFCPVDLEIKVTCKI
ncbi:hypothetical protein [Treponema sp.]|uniref:hypothetical protein n=1 Tax=Treponema sp. TaxID=166 RepID=UPI00257D2753|nr:hypothetical protein [Treponema sp.]